MTNREMAQTISARIGNSPVPFDSVYSISLQIYNELGGEPAQFDSVYSILLEILPLISGGGISSKVIDDNSIVLDKTWSSSKINSEIESLAGAANSEIITKETVDFKFVNELPVSGEDDELVVIKGDNQDTLYKYVSGEWVEQTPDANILYFDVENEALYSYVTVDRQFAPVSLVNTIVVGSNLNTNAELKAIKTPGVYNVIQRLTNKTKGDYLKNWTLTVESIDYEEYDKSDSIYQKLTNNYTIQKRTWSSTRATNDGWSNFSTYYAGEIKDTTTSKYYTWSSKKINDTRGYVYDGTDGSFETKYRQDEEDGGQELVNTATGYGAFAEGYNTQASGGYGSHAEGYETQATGNFGSHAEGYQTLASNQMGHAEGYGTKATGDYGAHAEGYLSEANEQVTHAEGRSIVNGRYGHGEGYKTEVKNYAEHAQGRQNVSHTDDEGTQTYNNPKRTIHSIGIGTSNSNHLNAVEVMTNGDYYLHRIGGYDGVHIKYETGYENTKTLQEVINGKQDTLTAGSNIDITNNTISAKGYTYDDTIGSIKQHNVAYGDDPSTEDNNIATGTNCAVFGQGNTTSSKCTLVAGESNNASNSYAVVAGYGNAVSKMAGVAFGRENTVAGQGGFAVGYKNNVTGQYAHAEGRENTASGLGSHVEGYDTSASGQATHAEGQSTSATSQGAHAEGQNTQATGAASHAEGIGSSTYGANVASGTGSHAEGVTTTAQNQGEHAEGNSNLSHKASDTYGNAGNTQHSVGIGEAATKKNAFEIMQNGDMYVYGVGGYQGTDTKVQDATIKTLQEYIASLEARIAALENPTV